jgi:hypothetical protein
LLKLIKLNIYFLFIIPFLYLNKLNAQDTTDVRISFFENAPEYSKSRAKIFTLGTAGLFASSMTGLYTLWYKNTERSSFHLFNDNREWMQMDKAGHVVTSYYLGKKAHGLMKWSGFDDKKATWYGGNVGLFVLSSVEVFDGFSKEWGFSMGDMTANTAGAALFIGQQQAWNEQRIILKYSFHQTEYAQHRPNVLGKDLKEQLLKDYNGQTYWLSANISSFIQRENKFPVWINIAAGYGAEGMTGGFVNVTDATPEFERYRQYYLSLDVDLSRLPLKKGFAKTLLSTINFIKIPFPAVEFNSKGDIIFHPFYF